jgi:hypothetical protein
LRGAISAHVAEAGIEPKWLEGQRIGVRGWVEQRRGSVIEADAPEQIELIGGGMGKSQEMGNHK